MNKIIIFFSRLLAGFLLLFICNEMHAQKPKDGTYTYKIAFAEWGGRSLGSTVSVVIKGDSIKIIADDKSHLSDIKKGDIIEQGILMKHKKTRQWIIGKKANDIFAKAVGNCSEGPTVIDFKHKRWWTC
jgi:hypothetical protein